MGVGSHGTANLAQGSDYKIKKRGEVIWLGGGALVCDPSTHLGPLFPG